MNGGGSLRCCQPRSIGPLSSLRPTLLLCSAYSFCRSTQNDRFSSLLGRTFHRDKSPFSTLYSAWFFLTPPLHLLRCRSLSPPISGSVPEFLPQTILFSCCSQSLLLPLPPFGLRPFPSRPVCQSPKFCAATSPECGVRPFFFFLFFSKVPVLPFKIFPSFPRPLFSPRGVAFFFLFISSFRSVRSAEGPQVFLPHSLPLRRRPFYLCVFRFDFFFFPVPMVAVRPFFHLWHYVPLLDSRLILLLCAVLPSFCLILRFSCRTYFGLSQRRAPSFRLRLIP